MKTPSTNRILLLCAVFIVMLAAPVSLPAQLQWYQNQDGNDQPNGTYGTSIQALGSSSFIACYLWTIENDQYTWKISRSNLNGEELQRFFVTGTTALAEVKVGNNNTVYVLVRNFPLGQDQQCTIYKLNSQLNILAQQTISFPNNFSIVNINDFQVDGSNNVYLAGDGQYPDGPGFSPASFVLKADKNLVTKWRRMDSTQTSYTRIHIRGNGMVVLVEDFYTFFPDVKITRITPNGVAAPKKIIHLDPNRLSLYSTLDNEDNLLLYGDKSVDAISQGFYLYKLSRTNENIQYTRTFFTSPGTEFKDLKVDRYGNIFTLVTQFAGAPNQQCRISRINVYGGYVVWNRSMPFSNDSCILTRLVVNDNNRFYAIGDRRSHSWYSGGFALRLKKTGQVDETFDAPDSTGYQRSHSLLDGIMDNNDQLVAIGNTNDLDTNTFGSSYFRSFAARFRENKEHHHDCDDKPAASAAMMATAAPAPADVTTPLAFSVYPNPARDQVTVTGIDPNRYKWIELYTVDGKRMWQQRVNETMMRIDVARLPEGMYIVRLQPLETQEVKSLMFTIKR